MSKAERRTCFLTQLEDKPGALLKIMKELQKKDAALTGLWGFSTGDGKGQLYSVGKDTDLVRSALKAAGSTAEEQTAFYVEGEDRTGALVAVLEALAGKGINIEAIDAVAVGGKFGSYVWVKEEDVEKAAKALG